VVGKNRLARLTGGGGTKRRGRSSGMSSESTLSHSMGGRLIGIFKKNIRMRRGERLRLPNERERGKKLRTKVQVRLLHDKGRSRAKEKGKKKEEKRAKNRETKSPCSRKIECRKKREPLEKKFARNSRKKKRNSERGETQATRNNDGSFPLRHQISGRDCEKYEREKLRAGREAKQGERRRRADRQELLGPHQRTRKKWRRFKDIRS